MFLASDLESDDMSWGLSLVWVISVDVYLNVTIFFIRATSPPSFALEVFVRCEGESKFKRLCNPFLYTPSAPYPLEVEVTSKI